MADFAVTDRLASGRRQVDDAPMQSPPSFTLQSLGTVTPEDRAALLMRPPLDISGPAPRTEGTPPLVDADGEIVREGMRGKTRPPNLRATYREKVEF